MRLDGVSKTYASGASRRSSRAALSGVDLDVPDGDTLAIVGPSGCGKTTLLRTIAGLERPECGRVRFDERDVTRAAVATRGVGFVFQSLALFEHLNVADNIGYGVRARGAARTAIVAEAAARARISVVIGDSPRRLSGGERQRVALARALATAPAVLLLDEPFSSLDAPLRAELRVEVARVRRELGATTILVTHDRADAFVLGDAIAVMENGRIVQRGTPERLLAAPATSFVASFLGTPGLALIDGRVDGGRFLAPGGVALAVAAPGGAGRLGVRAERVRLDAAGPLEGRLAVIERDASGAYAYVDGAFGTLVARVAAAEVADLRYGELVRLAIDPRGLHVFGADGRRTNVA